jgi:sterol desaturase/sphingolipid hydroxylase (fatty acid hydroxylase superfamily)
MISIVVESISLFLYSLKIVVDLFVGSFSTFLFMCYITKTHLWNREYTVEKINHKINVFVSNTVVGFTEAVLITDTLLTFRFVRNVPHTWIHSIFNMSLYIVLVEALNYVYHRLMHTPYFFKRIHYKHHEDRSVYPIDTFYMTFLDVSLNVLVLAIPVLFLRMNVMEYSIMTYFYVTGEFLAHSNILSNHHLIHHWKVKGNYCILFPIFDVLFGTHIQG